LRIEHGFLKRLRAVVLVEAVIDARVETQRS
jgi:hypothetical protein